MFRGRKGFIMIKQVVPLGICLLLVGSSRVMATDWPQFRGPDRTGVSKESGLAKSWPADGPKLLWKITNAGEGHATPSVAHGHIYGMGLRGNDEVVWALEEATGKEVWATKIADRIQLQGPQGGDGPRATPTVEGDRLYTLGVGGVLVCLERDSGKLVWKRDLVADFGGSVPVWGYSESPLVDGDAVIVTPGGTNTIVKLRKADGETIWKASIPGRNAAAYSSVQAATIGGVKQYIQFLSGGVVSVTADSGKLLWSYDSPANRQGISCSMPVVKGDYVFAATAYNTGGGLVKVAKQGDDFKADEVYFAREMQNHHGGLVIVGDHLYGFDNSSLVCMNLLTGEVAWRERSVGKGSIKAVDGLLVCRGERGEIALVEANPAAYTEKGRFMQPDRSRAPAWPYPVVANGKLLIRDQDTLLCYDVRASVASR
jgi:outer membrane protein assembly factor BamB